MKLKEIEKICKDLRRTIGRKFGYRQSDYINWKFKDGYFFCINTFDLHSSDLEVKPIFMDDLYWKIIYPDEVHKIPDSRRGDGTLSHLCMKIWTMDFSKDINKKNFSADRYEELISEVYLKVEEEIERFLRKYPNPNRFDDFLKDYDMHSELGEILLLINKEEYDAAYNLTKATIDRGPRCTTTYVMDTDDGDYIHKNEYEFVKEYCQSKLHVISSCEKVDNDELSSYFKDLY